MLLQIRYRCLVPAALFAMLLLLPAGVWFPSAAWAATQSAQTVRTLPSFAPLVKKVLPAVVNISAKLKSDVVGSDGREDQPGTEEAVPQSPLDELLRRFFGQRGIPRPPKRGEAVTLGSGFIIDSSGYIVTNSHVVQNAESITVIFNDNSRHPAKIVGEDRLTDLALLKVNVPRALPYVSWGDSDTAKVGDWVLAVGNPFGLANTVSYGIISARGREINAGPYDDFLQIDASINRGDSGGPTFDLDGRVIGVNTAIYSPSGGSVGIGFAIPADLAKSVIDQIRAHGRVVRGWLGVEIQSVTPEIARSLRLVKAAGALVADVIEGGPAAKAGFKQGDVILSVNGHDIGKARNLSIIVARTPVGKPADVELWRDGRRIRLTPMIAEMPQNVPNLGREENHLPGSPLRVPPRVEVLGLQLVMVDQQLRQNLGLPANVKGVLVLAVAPASPFASQDIESGDVIQMIDQRPVASPADVAKILNDASAGKSGTVLLLLNRGGGNLFVTLSIK